MEKHNKTFHLYGGKTFSSLEEFAKHLKTMSKDAFGHHVTGEKNDFSNWLRNSLEKKNLADRIEKKLDKIEMELEVLRHLVFEENKKTSKSTTSKSSSSTKTQSSGSTKAKSTSSKTKNSSTKTTAKTASSKTGTKASTSSSKKKPGRPKKKE